jgi:hypothetical protein
MTPTNTPTPATTTTAVVLWNADTEKQVRELIFSGKSVSKALVAVAPKGFVSKIRTERRNENMANTGRIMGELQQQGWQAYDLKPVKVNGRTGDKTMEVKFIQKATLKLTQAEEDEVVSRVCGLSIEEIKQMRAAKK